MLALLGLDRHLVVTDPLLSNRDFYGAMASTPRSLWLTQAEAQRCRRLMVESAPSFSEPWVCIANRDSTYLGTEYAGGPWEYHSYRNSKIQDYAVAVKALIDLGYFVIRMGRSVGEELPLANPRFFDYAVSDRRDDVLDFYLGFGCTFFLSTGSGVEDFAGVARRPRCYVNAVAFGAFRIEEPKSIHITKSHRDAVTNKVLTQSELIERGAHIFGESRQYKESQICLQDNSPGEIRDVALEMHSLVSGKYEQSPADKKAQERFWQIYPLDGLRAPGVPVRTLIGKQFLQDNPQWLK
jgi:putative glycosyltransferase (TIGR04372 family)